MVYFTSQCFFRYSGRFLSFIETLAVPVKDTWYGSSLSTTGNEESEKLLRSMPDLAEEDRHRISMMYERFAKKLANDYLYKVKAENAPEDVQVFLKCLEAIHE